jgi:hypothetical protein
MQNVVTQIFDNYSDARAAVQDLEDANFSPEHVGLIRNNADGEFVSEDGTVHEGINARGDVSRGTAAGAAIGGVGGLLAGLGLIAIPGLGPVVAAGWLASTLAAGAVAAVGGAAAGGVVGALRNAGHSDEESMVYAEGVRRGGTLVSVHVDEEHAEQVLAILRRHNGIDWQTRGSALRERGWNGYDESAVPYTPEEAAQERALYTGQSI